MPCKAPGIGGISAQSYCFFIFCRDGKHTQYIAIAQGGAQPCSIKGHFHRFARMMAGRAVYGNTRVCSNGRSSTRISKQLLDGGFLIQQFINSWMTHAACQRYLWPCGWNKDYVAWKELYVLRFIAIHQQVV